MPTAIELIPTYHQQYEAAEVVPAWKAQAQTAAKKIYASKGVYEAISRKAGGKIPYWWIGAAHNRESSLNFNTHLHCGDPLTARTVNEPKGRPATGAPPFTFEESALDALKMAPHKLHEVGRWSVERACYEAERYNGMGYLKRGKASPYVWSGTTIYHGGKFIADGVYSASAIDKQLGVVILWKELAAIDPDVAKAMKDREPGPPPEVIDKDTKDAKNGRKVGTGVAGSGVGGEVAGTQVPDNKPFFLSPAVTFTAIAVGIAMMVVCTILISRKVALAKAKWGQA